MVDGLKYYIECGIKLKAVKDSKNNREWIPWLRDNKAVLGFERVAAWRMMKVSSVSLAKHIDDSEALAILRKLWGHATGTQGHISIDRNWYTPK